MEQLTKEQAISIAKSGVWKDWPDRELVGFQLLQDRLCMDFSYFHEKVEQVLMRPVYTHEFAFKDNLIKEYLGDKPSPTLKEIMELIPENKRIIIIKQEKING